MILIAVAAGGIVYSTYAFTRVVREITSVSRYGGPIDEDAAELHLHDTYMFVRVGVGRFQLEVYPRLWAAILIILRLLAIAVGLIFILHVPLSHSA